MKTSAFSIARNRFSVALGVLLFIAFNPLGATEAPRSGAKEESKPAQFVNISGEVRFPQRYFYTDGMTLGTAIKLAKGVTAHASGNVTITREGGQQLTLDREAVEEGKAKDFELQPGDKIFVPKKQQGRR